MSTFSELNISKQQLKALNDLGFEKPTPIQEQSFSVIMSGTDMVGIAQTGTGKTFAYMLPVIRNLKYSEQLNPRVLVLVPTRELVLQVVEEIEKICKYLTIRVLGVYGGTNINTQKKAITEGQDIIVATPGRLYDLALSKALKPSDIRKIIIDEVDVMLDLGFRFQLMNIFEILPQKRQNIMFSATMTDDVEALINDYFTAPKKVSIAISGTPLDNISQTTYDVENFYTKANLLSYLLEDKTEFSKVLVFVSNKRRADLLFEVINERYNDELCLIHSNKTQNYRIRSIKQFEAGENRILVATDVMARGLDIDEISHVINFDTPNFPENYMHRIGRTGRAKKEGKSILFTTEHEQEYRLAVEELMDYQIPRKEFPTEVEVSEKLTREERPEEKESHNPHKTTEGFVAGAAFHEKSEKNSQVNSSVKKYSRELAKKYKKPRTRGDKNYNKRNKRK